MESKKDSSLPSSTVANAQLDSSSLDKGQTDPPANIDIQATQTNIDLREDVHVEHQITESEHPYPTIKKIFNTGSNIAEKYKRFLYVFKHQRCPFLVPVLDTVDEPEKHFQVISPKMSSFAVESNGKPIENLEGLLSAKCLKPELNMRATFVRISYQMMAGLAFLHERNVVHGDLIPLHVLFDEHSNVRLDNYGMYLRWCAEETVHTRQPDAAVAAGGDAKCFNCDLLHFASILLCMLMKSNAGKATNDAAMSDLTKSRSWLNKIRESCNINSSPTFKQEGDELLIREKFDYKSFTQKSFSLRRDVEDSSFKIQEDQSSGEVLIKKSFNWKCFIEKYADKDKWKADKITCEIVLVLLKCLWMKCDQSNARKLASELKSIMKLFRPALEAVMGTKHSTKCWYCTVEPMHPEMKLRCPPVERDLDPRPKIKFWRNKRTKVCPETCPLLCVCSSCMALVGACFSVDSILTSVCSHRVSQKTDDVETICPIHSDDSQNIDPIYQCTIEPIIGGSRAYAMILCDTSPDIADKTNSDAAEMVQLASHPKIMQIPFNNVYERKIPAKTDSSFEHKFKCIEKDLKDILKAEPSYFLFYYSGHQLVEEKNPNEPLSGYEKLVKILRYYKTQIAKVCPRIFDIIDCCCAEAVADLFEVKLADEKQRQHSEWHAVWMSSRRHQFSYTEADHQLSSFTHLVVSALKGGMEMDRKCPSKTENCYKCSCFRKSCNEDGYVTLHDSASFVQYHLQETLQKTQEGPSDVQDPVFRVTHDGKPIIVSHCCKESKLYTVYVENMFNRTIRECPTDSVDISSIWRLTVDNRSKEAQHVKIYKYCFTKLLCEIYLSDKSDNDMRSTKCILDAVSKDSKCLLVKIDDSSVENVDSDDSDSTQTSTSESQAEDMQDASSDDCVQFQDNKSSS